MTDTSLTDLPHRKLFIKTWGCQMNVYDSARMADVVKPLGYGLVDEMADADLVIFNTCHIREKASEKLYSELGRLREIQKERAAKGDRILVAVAGCVAQAEGAEIQRRASNVDMVFGPQTYHQLPEMIARVTRTAGHVLNTDFPPEAKFDFLPDAEGASAISAFLSIQEGCDKFCSYCVVPYTRGSEYARPVASVLEEARRLVAHGAREITLLGQNVNAYRAEDAAGQSVGLAGLLYQLAEIPDLKRLRFMTSYPNEMDEALIAAHGDLPQLMPFLHLPVQSGSDKILAAMNRKYTGDDYRKLIDKLRAKRPDLALSSDFIVGFPGETPADFRATLKLVQDVTFAQAFSFKYSRRPGTPAASLPAQLPEKAKDERLQELQALLRTQQDAFNQSKVGTTLPVLIETLGHQDGQVRGRSPYLQTVHLNGTADLITQEIPVRITSFSGNSLHGERA